MSDSPLGFSNDQKPEQVADNQDAQHEYSRYKTAIWVAGITVPFAFGAAIFVPRELRDAFGVLLSALATAVIAAFTYTLWRSTDRMQEITRQTLRHLEREYVTANRPQLRMRQLAFELSEAAEPTIHYTIANTGQSRARVIESNLTAWLPAKGDEWPGRPRYSAAKDSLGQITIEAGQDYVGVYQDAPDEMDLLIAEIVKDKHTDTVLLGYVIYLDDNDTPRRLGFCRKRSPAGGRFVDLDPADPDYEFFY